jgi:8-oxo-dGTP pyrophosphatase MutT (NUDIX family)
VKNQQEGGLIKDWEILDSKNEKAYHIFTLRSEKSRNPRNGLVREVVILDFPEWISIIPLTEKNEVVMVRQFRHGVKEILLEIPGGLMDKEDASPMRAAQRELVEETGYTSGNMECIGSLYPQPAVQSNRYHIFLARNAEKTQSLKLDEGEDIETVLVPLRNIPAMIQSGEICHAMVVTAFYYLALHMGKLVD